MPMAVNIPTIQRLKRSQGEIDRMVEDSQNPKNMLHVWLGCTSRAFLKGSVENLFKTMQKIDLRFKVIDDLDICCGSVLFVTGQNKSAMQNLKQVEKTLVKKKVNHLISLCPGCTRTFKEHYLPRKTNPLKTVAHYTEILLPYIDKFEFKSRGNVKVTYHDPCHLARHMGITEPPRDIIKALPGVQFTELPTHHEDAFCCGSGGGLRSYNKDLANNTSLLRLREADSLQVDYLLTTCPFCERSFMTAQELPGAPKKLKIKNLIDFLPMYYKK
jgi:heterodisulfide reductase subunit D